jgi:hypothetical protein
MDKKLFWREFWILWGLSVVLGTILIWQVHIPSTYFAMRLLLAGHTWGPLMFAVEALQSVLVLTIAVGVGLAAAHALGLGAPILENLLSRQPVASHLRAMVVPVLLVGAAVGAVRTTAALPILQPNRNVSREFAVKIASQPLSPQLQEKIRQTSSSVTLWSEAVSYVCGPLSGELIGRLFTVSGVAWLLAKVTGDRSRPPGRVVVLSAIVLATAVLTTLNILDLQETNRQLRAYLSDVLPNMPPDSAWSLVVRHLFGSIPAGVGFGWLYVRYGLEAAVLGVFVAGFVGHELFLHFVLRLY